MSKLHCPVATKQLLIGSLMAAFALAGRWPLEPWLGSAHAYTLAIAAIALAGCYGSWLGGIATAILYQLGATYLFTGGRLAALQDSVAVQWADLTLYYLVAAVVLVMSDGAGRATQKLDKLSAALRETDVRRAQFLAVVAHELRNPLAALRMGAMLLTAKAEKQATRDTGAMMERQLAQMARLVSDLLDVARIEQGKLHLTLEVVPVRDAVRQAVQASEAFVRPKNQVVSVEVVAQADAIEADPNRLMQMLGNLLHNASKFSAAGSTIRVKVDAAPQGIAISVQDRGIGIASDQIERIFGTFVQVNCGAQDGLGIGLSLVRQLMALHGGVVQVRSDGPGHGATFTLVFRGVAMRHPADIDAGSASASPSNDACAPVRINSWSERHMVRPVRLEALEQEMRSTGPST